jgi:hypothetical protein
MEHGTSNAYGNYGCRCQPCRDAWAKTYNRYRQRRKSNGICVECSLPTVRGLVRCEKHNLANRQAARAYYQRNGGGE